MQNKIPKVLSINISKGGVPKLPVPSVRLTFAGLEGDGHNHAKHYNPLQAVCIQDIESLGELNQNGYELLPGKAGENLTVQDLNVNSLPLGTILQFSGGVRLEVSRVRKPCYVMDAIHVKLKEDALGRHGMYARVLQEGVLEKGETIDVMSPSQESISGPCALWPHTGAIFCGGKSLRMGKPKAAIISPRGNTLVEHVHSVLAQLCKKVVLVGHGEGVPDSLKHLERIQDNCPGLGPMGALESLLSSGIDSEYLVSSCDLPCATLEVFSLLLGPEVQGAVVLSNKGRLEPLLGRYPSAVLPFVQRCIETRRLAMKDLLQEVSATSIDVPERYSGALCNMNTPGDIERVNMGEE